MNFLSKLYSDCSLLLPSSLVKCLDRGFHDINSLFFSVHKDSTERHDREGTISSYIRIS